MKIISLVVFLLLASGCSLLRPVAGIETPSVAWQNFHIDGISTAGLDLLFDFQVTNPNNREARAESYSYEFFIDGEPLLSGTSSEPLVLGAGDSQLIRVPLVLNFNRLYRSARALSNRDSIGYRLETEVEFDLPVVGTRRVPVTAEGYLPVVHMPQISFEGFEMKRFSFSEAEFEARVRVVNPNSFGFSFANVGYSLEINSSEWVDSRLDNAIRIGANSDAVIPIPVTLSGSELGAAVLGILSGAGSFRYQIRGGGEIDVDLPYVRDTAFLPFDFSGQYRMDN